jgi:histidine triad (HIT) family protein
VFCRIVAGEIPARIVFADDLVLAFLDIAPLNPGHTLVVPREHHCSITTVPAPTLARLLQVGAAAGAAVMHAVKADGFNLHLANGSVAGQVVPHAHLHIIPRFPADGVGIHWRAAAYASSAEADAVLQEIRKRLPGPCCEVAHGS